MGCHGVPPFDDAGIQGRPADVEGQQVLTSQHLGEERSADDTAGGAGQDRVRGRVLRRARRHGSATGSHDEELAGEPLLVGRM